MGFADVTRTDAVFPASRPTVLQPSIPARDFVLSPGFSFFLFFFPSTTTQKSSMTTTTTTRRSSSKYEEQQEDDVNGRRGDELVGRRRRREVGRVHQLLVGGGCKILQPRGTHRDDVISTTEAGDVLQSRGPPTTKSLGFPCMNGPFSLACL